MTLKIVALGLVGLIVVAGSLWSPTQPELEPSQLARLETGVTSYEEVLDWWGPGTLVGKTGKYCGAIRSQHDLAGEQQLELLWEHGVVCDWKVAPEVASAPPPQATSG